jgi:hypothetical protein
MDRLWDLNLLHFFNFYLGVAFVLSTTMRWRQYEAIVGLVRAVPERWPRLFQLVKQHHGIFLTWTTVLPAFLALALWLIHWVACRFFWPQANLTVGGLTDLPWILPLVAALLGVGMLGVDVYATFRVGEVDRSLLEKYFDQAEYWLRPWLASAVRVVTMGYINPRRMVAVEVQKALVEASRLLNVTLWWVIVQTGLRIAFGLFLWLAYAWS